MHIVLITPAPPGSKAGNRATAERWSGLLTGLGHSVDVVIEYSGQPCDLFIALHAWRSSSAIKAFRQHYPETPLIVVLTGTDIYHHQHAYPQETLESMRMADCLIGLHRQVAQDIPAEFEPKLVTVLQSADQPSGTPAKTLDEFNVCVIGHLRDEKDSLRAALAARLLPESSHIQILNAGKPHNAEWEAQARDEDRTNPRFRWLGEIDKPETQQLMQTSRVMVISSVMEGGANVVSEACRVGLPILASDISGNIGLLGEHYPGYFRTKNEADLARLMRKAETDPSFLRKLTEWVDRLAPLFSPEAEQQALADAINMASGQPASNLSE